MVNPAMISQLTIPKSYPPMASHGCYVYHPQSSAWEPLGFPRHSIMGVGTNYFPMKVDKLPQLQKLLSDEERFFFFPARS